MNLTQRLLLQNDCYRAGRTILPKGVMVHSLGVAQPDPEVFIRQWNKLGVEVAVHAIVGTGGAAQLLPWNYRGWHAGVGTSGLSANGTHISFECCEPAGHTYQGGEMIGYDVEKNAAYFAAVYQNAVDLTVYLCHLYGLDPLADGVVICHAEGFQRGIASNHADVLHWWPKHGVTMDDFRADVAAGLNRYEEDDDMLTQEQFHAMMDVYLAGLAAEPPSSWSAQAREWAESQGLINGDENGNRQYKRPCTREELAQILYNQHQGAAGQP